MIFDSLISGTLIKRYKRFLVDVALEDGSVLTAHCANSGAMLGINIPGQHVWLSKSSNPNRKLAYTLEIVQENETMVGANTH